MTDLIREVREASRIRDESLLNKVKSIIDEKNWMSNESNLRIMRELEEIKVSLLITFLFRNFTKIILDSNSRNEARKAKYE